MTLVRLDHVGVVVGDLAAHTAQLEALGLRLDHTNPTAESDGHYFPCGDASVELIDVHDPAARARRLPAGDPAVIEHIAFQVDDLQTVRDALTARGVSVSWPPFRSGERDMIWTDAASSGGVQYQFMRPVDGQA
jgi:catechol 2,3-dioxygenase-like lactoylglutathione lyase family enzyme